MTSRPLQDSPSPITTVVFDYGEVLSVPPPESRSRLVALSGVPAEQFWDAYWHERRAYDAGLDSREYWDRVGARLNISWDPAVRQELWATDMGGWLVPEPEAAALAARLTASPLRVALLSNAPHDLAAPLRFSPLLCGFDALFFSCEIGLCKPDSRVYERHWGSVCTTTPGLPGLPHSSSSSHWGDPTIHGRAFPRYFFGSPPLHGPSLPCGNAGVGCCSLGPSRRIVMETPSVTRRGKGDAGRRPCSSQADARLGRRPGRRRGTSRDRVD